MTFTRRGLFAALFLAPFVHKVRSTRSHAVWIVNEDPKKMWARIDAELLRLGTLAGVGPTIRQMQAARTIEDAVSPHARMTRS